jgi:hypothetical protein
MAANLAQQSETKFWHDFFIHVTGQGPSVDDLVVTTHTLATLLGSVVDYGANPVSESDFEAALAQWVQDGRPTQDQGAVKGVVARIEALVENALPKGTDPLVGRFWRLRLMSKMGTLSTIS